MEVLIPADLYADLTSNLVSDKDPSRGVMGVGEMVLLIVQEAWADADEQTPWLQRVFVRLGFRGGGDLTPARVQSTFRTFGKQRQNWHSPRACVAMGHQLRRFCGDRVTCRI